MPRLSLSVVTALRENKTPKNLKLIDTIQDPQLLLALWYAWARGSALWCHTFRSRANMYIVRPLRTQ